MCALLVLMAAGAHAQVDSTITQFRQPRQALSRALLPGWGQLYNRQFAKIPVIYAGLGIFGGAALNTNRKYRLYGHAYLFTAREDGSGLPIFPQYAEDYARLLSELGLPPEGFLTPEEVIRRRARLEPQFRAQRDNFRRNRDLLYIGMGIWYGLTILDAFVSAHLFDFDVGEDLAMRLVAAPGLHDFSAAIVIYR